MDFIKTYYEVDSYKKANESQQKGLNYLTDNRMRNRESQLTDSEIATILICYHYSGFRNFKKYYEFLKKHFRHYFPDLVSYDRFLVIQEKAMWLMCAFFGSKRGKCTGLSYIDSTSLQVSKPKRISQHHVFKRLARIGKTSIGWFYGFKLHLIINHRGEILAAKLTSGNVSDLSQVHSMANSLFGKLFGDKGYISKTLFEKLFKQGIQLVTGVRKSMKNSLLNSQDFILLKKRSVVESAFNLLKNYFNLEHSRFRSVKSFMVNIISTLNAYSIYPKKPSIHSFLDQLP
jgi:transposase